MAPRPIPPPPVGARALVAWVGRARSSAAATGATVAIQTTSVEGSSVRVYVHPDGDTIVAVRPSSSRPQHRGEVAARLDTSWAWHAPFRELRRSLGAGVGGPRVAVWVRRAVRACSGAPAAAIGRFGIYEAAQEFACQEATRQRSRQALAETPVVVKGDQKWIAFKNSRFR